MRRVEAHGTGHEELYRTPDARVAVAYVVQEHEDPSGCHKHRDVAAYLAVPAVVTFAGRAPLLLLRHAGEVDRRHFDDEVVRLAGLHVLRDVHGSARKHSCGHCGEGSVQVDFAAVVDALWTHPHRPAAIRRGNIELRAERRGVELAVLGEIWDEFVLKLVVETVVRGGNDAVLDERRQHRAGHNGRHPAAGRGG